MHRRLPEIDHVRQHDDGADIVDGEIEDPVAADGVAVVPDACQEHDGHVVHEAGRNGHGGQEEGVQGHFAADEPGKDQVEHAQDDGRFIAPEPVRNPFAAEPEQTGQKQHKNIAQQGIDEPFHVIPEWERFDALEQRGGMFVFSPEHGGTEQHRQYGAAARPPGKPLPIQCARHLSPQDALTG